MTSKRQTPVRTTAKTPAEMISNTPSKRQVEEFHAALVATNPVPQPAKSLAEIRSNAISASSSAAHTIAELEAWRNEIDATIAFLKAQRK
jgi:hypothetical protein